MVPKLYMVSNGNTFRIVQLYDDAEGRVVRPQRAIVAPIHNIIYHLVPLFSRSGGACARDAVFQLWLNFNSYVSPTHPPYVQYYWDVTVPGYGVTVIMSFGCSQTDT
jgi:hypothetical protein